MRLACLLDSRVTTPSWCCVGTQKMFSVDEAHCEPHCQHQNQAKSKIQDVKRAIDNTVDCVGCPACAWPLCAIFTLVLFHHLPNLKGEIPLVAQMGQTLDVSEFVHFHFWQKVPVELHQWDKTEELTCWCHPAKNIGDKLTNMVLLTDFKHLVPHSDMQLATDPLCPNPQE